MTSWLLAEMSHKGGLSAPPDEATNEEFGASLLLGPEDALVRGDARVASRPVSSRSYHPCWWCGGSGLIVVPDFLGEKTGSRREGVLSSSRNGPTYLRSWSWAPGDSNP